MANLEALLARHTGGPGRVLVAVDGVYSMDGDLAPLADLVRLKSRYGAFLLLDESHAVGVLGAQGRGTPAHAGVAPGDIDVITGSLGKAFPSGGGFVARRLLDHGIYASAVPYPAVAAGRSRLRLCATAQHTDEDFVRLEAALRATRAAEA